MTAAAGPWVPVGERLPPTTDEGWCRESARVLVRSVEADKARVRFGYVRIYPADDWGPERVAWYMDGPDAWEITNATHWAEVNEP